MTNTDIHPFETMIVVMSRLIKNGETAATGTLSPIPAAALILAKQLHAPDITALIYGDSEFRVTDGLHEVFGLAHRGLLDLFFLSGIQIDQAGSINLSVIGDYSKPKLRLPGGAGSNMISMMAGRIILFTMSHTTRLFVPKVCFTNATAQDDTIPWRRGKLSHIVTPLALLKYNEKQKVVKIDSVYPGVSYELVAENTGFDLGKNSSDVPVIDPVSNEELRLLREVVLTKLREIYPLFCDMIWGNKT